MDENGRALKISTFRKPRRKLKRRLRIGLSPRILHNVPKEMGFKGKTLQYLEQSIAHWVMTGDAMVMMLPSIEQGGIIRRTNLRVLDYAEELDGLLLQGGSDVCPHTYGEQPARPEWNGDRIRDQYEIELIQAFVELGNLCSASAEACSLSTWHSGAIFIKTCPPSIQAIWCISIRTLTTALITL